MKPTLSQALDLARAGDERGYSAIYAELAASVTRYAHSRSVEDPEQLTNDVFVAAFSNLASFTGDDDQLRGWVFTIVRNKVIDDARRRGRRPVVIDADVPEITAPAAETEALRALEPDDVARELSGLTAEQREVLLLRLVAGLTVVEVAETIGRDIGAVKALQRRGIRRLQKELGADHPVEEISNDPYPSDDNRR